jgi:hypothetical protein
VKAEAMKMATTQQAFERTGGRFDPAEAITLAIAAVVGVGANVALALTVATFLYALVTLM